MQPGSDGVSAFANDVPASADAVRTVAAARLIPGDAERRLRRDWRTARAEGGSVVPDLADYLPDSESIRRRCLMQLIAVDLQERWLRAHRPKRLAEYCADFRSILTDFDVGSLPVDLVYEEFCIRRQSGDSVTPAQYVREYPAHEDALARLLNIGSGENTEMQSPDLDATGPQETISQDTSPQDSRSQDTRPGAAPTHPGSSDELEDLDAGDRVDDFDLLMGLGRGAFARVFLARQRSMQRIVAVKISSNHGSEPQMLAQLDHDYIVRVFDQRILPGRGLRLLYMQYLPGGTLLDLLRRVRACPVESRSGQLLLDTVDAALESRGSVVPTDSSIREHISTLSWPETVAWLGRRLADALHYAGVHGILHRDIKPANILLTAEGVPKLADFNIGFSDQVDGDSPVAYFGGSLSYMSPEQLEACHPSRPGRADQLDTRSDLYSLGVVLWELLTGSKPFDDAAAANVDGDRTVIDALLTAREDGVTAAAQASLPADCPATLRRVLLTCLSADVDQRLPGGHDVAQQLDLCLDRRARALVDPPPTSARARLRPFTVPVMTAAIGIPNVTAAVYNYQHNKALIIGDLIPVAQDRFETVTVVINGLFWPIGLALIVYFFRHVLAVPAALRGGRDVSDDRLAQARADTLRAAGRVVAVCLGLWICAGIAFPVSLQIAAGSVPGQAYVHFIASLVVCGAMATAYPFFLVSLFTVRCLYPSLLPYGSAGDRDHALLDALSRRSVGYLTVAAAIPLVAVAGLTFVPASDIPGVLDVVRVVCIGGIAAFVASYAIFRSVELDLGALRRVVTRKPTNQL
ncbi:MULTISPECIES: serine/threonine-protein kinase [Nocardiaceae]|uniref:serine/threonine-protein kinase n=1 Tax=Nocardiaceae TaxID=85025 RepID=UPI0009B873A7|nr:MULTISPECIES: serine/threonine-protein kinase [Rhodococcus]